MRFQRRKEQPSFSCPSRTSLEPSALLKGLLNAKRQEVLALTAEASEGTDGPVLRVCVFLHGFSLYIILKNHFSMLSS